MNFDLIFLCVVVYLATMPTLAVLLGRMLARRDQQIPTDVRTPVRERVR